MESIFWIILVICLFGGSILRVFFNHREKMKRIELAEAKVMQDETQEKLLDEVKKLNMRIEVLEKIVTDGKYELDKKIANL